MPGLCCNSDRSAITAEVATEGFAAGDEVAVVIPELDISQTARISDRGDAQPAHPGTTSSSGSQGRQNCTG